MYFVAQSSDCIGEVVGYVRDRRGKSRRVGRHLPRDQQVDLAPMILVIGETFIDLGPGEAWETPANDAVHGFPVLEQADHVMNTDARPGHDSMAASYPRCTRNVRVR